MTEVYRNLRVGRSVLMADMRAETRYHAFLYPVLPNVDWASLPEAPLDVLGAISDLKVDTVNACNYDCVFCHSDFSAKTKQLEVEDFADALGNGRFPLLQCITLGCAYEPLMGKYFEDYPDAIPDLKGRLKVRIVTNGALLHRKDLGPWAEFGLEKLFVSVYSHIPEVYDRTARGAGDFRQLERNLLDTRRRFPALEINLTNPLTKSNDVDVGDFCRWAFEYIGVNSVDLRRAFFDEKPAPVYPAYTYKEAATALLGRSPAINDEEWIAILNSCADFMDGAQKRTIVQGAALAYDSIVLSAPQRVAAQLAALAS